MMRKYVKAVLCFIMIVAMLAAPLSASAASVARIMRVNGDWVRMHDADGAFLGHLRKGTKVLYWGVKDDAMYKVMLSSGKTCYVYKEYLTTYGAMYLDKIFVTNGSPKMYNGSREQISTLRKGRYVMVYKTAAGWAYVKTMGGQGGFVQTANLDKAF